jgi:hypothetical protein
MIGKKEASLGLRVLRTLWRLGSGLKEIVLVELGVFTVLFVFFRHVVEELYEPWYCHVTHTNYPTIFNTIKPNTPKPARQETSFLGLLQLTIRHVRLI